MIRNVLLLITVSATLIQACPSGWKENEEHCYYFSSGIGSWSYAGSYCRNFNAKLAEPMEPADVVFIDTAVKSTHPTIGEYFLGGGYFFVEGQWIWASTLLPISHGNWSPGEPNDQGTGEDCLAVVLNGLWNDVPCNISLPFVCELENDFGQETIG